MKKKSLLSSISIFIIVLAIYILAFLLIPFKKNTSSWISFGFTIFAIIAGAFAFLFAFEKKDTLISKFYGVPVFKIGCLYSIIQLCLGIVVCVIAAFVAIPLWVVLLVHIILLAIAIVCFLFVDNTRDLIEEMDKDSSKKTQAFDTLKFNIACVVDVCESADLKKELIKLKEKFDYSDPVTSEGTEEIEDRLLSLIVSLKQSVVNSENNVNAKIKEIELELNERNRLCKIYKKTI